MEINPIIDRNKSHYRDKCDIVTEVNLRKQRLRELRYCFKCLRGNHIARNWRQKYFATDVKLKIGTIPQYVKNRGKVLVFWSQEVINRYYFELRMGI